MRILLYQAHQNEIGGVETFNYNFCKRLSKFYKITFVCDSADPAQVARIEKYVPVVIYDGQYFETDICIYSAAWGKRPEDHIKAKRYIQMVHADFTGIEKHWNFQYKKTPKTTEHIGGGENIAKTFKNKYGYDCKAVHYLLDDDVKVSRVLQLITVSRIAKEKGMIRLIKMAQLLQKSGRKFNWNIWGSGFSESYVNDIKKRLQYIPEVVFRGVKYDLSSEIADADYLVQLSDSEGYCFSIYEALSLETPVIATDFPNALEQIKDGETGYILDMELNNFDVKKIYSKIPKFKFEPVAKEEDWIEVLGKPDKGRINVKVSQPAKMPVVCLKPYRDVTLNKKIKPGMILQVTEERAKILTVKKLVKAMEVII